MAMVVTKPKELPEQRPIAKMYDFVRAETLQNYNDQRVDDKDQYEAWLEAYTQFSDDPTAHRVQVNKVEVKGVLRKKRLHINKCWATWLEDGDSWGNANSPTKANAIQKTEMSIASRVRLVHNAPSQHKLSWKPRVVTEGFEHLGRPPTLQQVLLQANRYGSTTSVDINTSGVYEDEGEETLLVYEPDDTWVEIEKLEAHINLSKEISFLKKLSNKSANDPLYNKFMSKAVHLGHDFQSSWKQFMMAERAGTDRYQLPDVDIEFTPQCQAVLDEYKKSMENYPLEYRGMMSREKASLRHMKHNKLAKNTLRMKMVKYYQESYPCRYVPFSSLSKELRHIWDSCQHYERKRKYDEHLALYGTKVSKMHMEQEDALNNVFLSQDEPSLSWLFWTDSFTDDPFYKKWLYDHDAMNKGMISSRKSAYLHDLASRMFFESLPMMSTRMETYHSRTYYNNLDCEKRYDMYWDYIVPSTDDSSAYDHWLVENTLAEETNREVIMNPDKVPHGTIAIPTSPNFYWGGSIDKLFTKDLATGLFLPPSVSLAQKRDKMNGEMLPIIASPTRPRTKPLSTTVSLEGVVDFFKARRGTD